MFKAASVCVFNVLVGERGSTCRGNGGVWTLVIWKALVPWAVIPAPIPR